MDLSTVEIPRTEARASAAEYARAAKEIKDPDRRREFEEIARAYRAAAKTDAALIALTPTLRAGGTITRTLVHNRGMSNERRERYALPALAVCRWDAAYAYTMGIQTDGSIEFIDSLQRSYRYMKGRLSFETRFTLPEGYKAGTSMQEWTHSAWASMVPVVPPKHRPRRGMANCLVLWEATWEWKTLPVPPGDPALLRPIGGDLYAVEAVWDLTELERMVLTGRRP